MMDRYMLRERERERERERNMALCSKEKQEYIYGRNCMNKQ